MNKSTPVVQILNTIDKTVTIRNIRLNYKPISSYYVMNICKKNFHNSELEKSTNKILDSNKYLNSSTAEKLHLSDNTPVYTKNYRLPHSEKE